jgi:4-hydroxy 2-oxovalerate aldolase
MEKIDNVQLLDCTLRDGGYYNNWDFDQELVQVYLKSMEQASIDVIEIGFRSPPKKSFMGPYVYSLDDHLESLPLPENILIGVMINAKEYLKESDGPVVMINKLFQPCDKSPVGLVRIAINFDQVLEAEVLTSHLKELGYQVGLNMMQSHGKEELKYKQVARQIYEWGNVDVLYFADSLGNMNPSQIKFICNALKSGWQGPLGIHTHNNKDFALINSLTALDEGVTWCDATVTGMGRGAGNVSTETLLMEINSLGLHPGNAQTLTNCVEHFDALKQSHKWGPNPHYHYAANNSIHPTFVQTLLNDPRYKSEEINVILNSLAEKPSTSFNELALRNSVYRVETESKEGSWDATGWIEGRNVLFVGAGTSVKKYSHAIINYIKQHKPAVLFLNINEHIPASLGDGTIVAHEGRSLFDFSHYHKLGHPLIIPPALFKIGHDSNMRDLRVFNYGLTVQNGAFEIKATGCVLQWPLAFAYALAIATQAKANEIQMVGFDGYEANDPRQEEMNEVFAGYANNPDHLSLKSLTPTNYPIQQGSIFEPVLELNDFVVVIPARYHSSRFPGKPLADLCGKSLIRRVWDKCVQAVGKENVIVATEDQKILEHCQEQGMKATMTSSECLTGTDRVCEIARKIDREIIINVQGDEPLIDPKDILTVLEAARRNKGTIINGMCPIEEENDFRNPNVPKVVTSPDGRLLYMSRAPIPTGKKLEFKGAMRQVCIYAFPRKAILEFGRSMEKTKTEAIEDIEILRFLEMGYSVKMVQVKGSPVAVDTPEDLLRAEALLGI